MILGPIKFGFFYTAGISTKSEFLFFAVYGRNPVLKVLKLLNTDRSVQKVLHLSFYSLWDLIGPFFCHPVSGTASSKVKEFDRV